MFPGYSLEDFPFFLRVHARSVGTREVPLEPRRNMLPLFRGSAIETQLVSFLPIAKSGERKAA
jgi:hypothetical protein